MSYTTFVNIRVLDHGTMTRKEAKEAFDELCEKADLCMEDSNLEDLETEFEDNNNNAIKSFTEESKRYPQLLLEGYIDGTTEDSDDQRMVRIRDGQIETVMAEITYEPFEKLLTAQEKRNRQPVLEQLNKVELIGAVGMASSQTIGENTLVRFSVATNYAYKDREGNFIIDTTWHNVCAWENDNPKAAGLSRGDKVHVLGRIRIQKYITENGETRSAPEIIATKVERIGDPELPFAIETQKAYARA